MCKMNIDLLLKYLDIFFFISDFSSDVFISLVIYLSCSFVFTLFIIIGFVMPGLVFFVDEKINRRRRCSLSLMFTTFALPVVTISLAFQSLLYPEDHLLRVKYSSLREYDVVWESLPQYIFQLFLLCRVGFDSSHALETILKFGSLLTSFLSMWKGFSSYRLQKMYGTTKKPPKKHVGLLMLCGFWDLLLRVTLCGLLYTTLQIFGLFLVFGLCFLNIAVEKCFIRKPLTSWTEGLSSFLYPTLLLDKSSALLLDIPNSRRYRIKHKMVYNTVIGIILGLHYVVFYFVLGPDTSLERCAGGSGLVCFFNFGREDANLTSSCSALRCSDYVTYLGDGTCNTLYISEKSLFYGIIPAMFGLLLVSSLEFISFGCFDRTWMDWTLEKVFETRTDIVEVDEGGNDMRVTYQEDFKMSVTKTESTNFEEVSQPLDKALTQLYRDSADLSKVTRSIRG